MLQGTSVSIDDLVRLRSKTQGLQLPQNQSFYFTGRTRSSILGRGMEYEESRKYAAGDDARMIDWRVTARTGTAHTKVFREDRQRTVYLLVDMSSTMRFGTRVAFKSVIAAEAAALISWTALQQGDLVCTVGFNDSVLKHARSTSNSGGLLRHFAMLSELSSEVSEGSQSKTNLRDACATLKNKIRTGDLVVVLSDFCALTDEDIQSLEFLGPRRFLTTCWILDRIERQALPKGRYPITDRLQFSTLNLITQRSARKMQEVIDRRNQRIEQALEQLRAPVIQLEPGDDVVRILFKAFHGMSRWKLRMARHQQPRSVTRVFSPDKHRLKHS